MARTLRIKSVTGIDVDLEIAGPGGRSYAFVIDWHIRVVLALAWLIISALALTGTLSFADLDSPPDTTVALIIFAPMAAIYYLYHPVLELLMQGRSPGKRMAGIRVVSLDGGIPTFGAILIRNLFRLIDSLPFGYCVGLATTIMTENSVRIGDLAAGTVLVYDAGHESTTVTEISAAAVERLGLERAEVVSDLYDRWDGLEEPVRQKLARDALAAAGESSENLRDIELRSALKSLLS